MAVRVWVYGLLGSGFWSLGFGGVRVWVYDFEDLGIEGFRVYVYRVSGLGVRVWVCGS